MHRCMLEISGCRCLHSPWIKVPNPPVFLKRKTSPLIVGVAGKKNWFIFLVSFRMWFIKPPEDSSPWLDFQKWLRKGKRGLRGNGYVCHTATRRHGEVEIGAGRNILKGSNAFMNLATSLKTNRNNRGNKSYQSIPKASPSRYHTNKITHNGSSAKWMLNWYPNRPVSFFHIHPLRYPFTVNSSPLYLW